MATPPGDGRGNRNKSRFHLAQPSAMLTRHGRRSPNEEENAVVRALEDAGVADVSAMTAHERSSMLQALEASKVGQVEAETQRLSLNSQISLSPEIAETHSTNLIRYQADGSQIDTSLRSSSSRDIFDSLLDSSLENTSQTSEPSPVSKVSVEEKQRPSKLSLAGKSQSVKGIGRGRGVPVKTKYPALPITSPGQKPNSNPSAASDSYPSSPENRSCSPIAVQSPLHTLDSAPTPQDCVPFPRNHQSLKTLAQISHNDSLSQEILSSSSPVDPIKNSPSEATTQSLDNNTIIQCVEVDDFVDVEAANQEEVASRRPSSLGDYKPDSPASVEDAEQDIEVEEQEPVKTVKVGKCFSTVSPLEAMMTSWPVNQLPPYFQELEKYRGNKLEWMAKAKEMAQAHRHTLWKKLLVENPQWGAPIGDGGDYNKQTLFKQMRPKYRQLFSNSDKQAETISVRFERQPKSQAMARIQDTRDDWNIPDSPRKSQQKDDDQGNAWNSRKKVDTNDVEDDDECREEVIPCSSNERWHSNRIEQRGRLPDSDSEASPESPNPGGSHDVYAFDETWELAPAKNKKNSKRGTKSIQCDVEVEGKTSNRGRGASQRGKSAKARVQRGAIARPSEHGAKSRNKVSSSDQIEGETNTRNNVNSERAWLTTVQSGSEGSDIAPKKFYPSKVVQPRSNRSPQPRRPNDFPSSPGSSHNFRQPEARNEAASVETQECPICGKDFPSNEIVAHCSGCVDFKDGAVGDEPPLEIQDSEDSDGAVKDMDKAKPSTRDTAQAIVTIQCSLCKQHFTTVELADHFPVCVPSAPSPSTGHKRVSSPECEDRPAKKISRLTK